MNIPKSKKLAAEEERQEEELQEEQEEESIEDQPGPTQVIQIRKVDCLNDFVAILQFEHGTNIELTEEAKFKNEGLVVGIGPGMSNGAGGRLESQVNIGDVVMFGKGVIANIDSKSPPYAGKRVVIVSERNLICKLPTKIEYEHYKEDA